MGMIAVPVSLLLEPELAASAKLIWMVLRLRSSNASVDRDRLESDSGLSRPTVQKGLAQLESAGWYAAAAGQAVEREPVEARVSVPGDLLADRSVGVQGRVIYGLLQATPLFCYPHGQFTYAGLCALSGRSNNTVRAAIGVLVRAGWLKTEQEHQLAPVCFTLTDPTRIRGKGEVARARQRLDDAPYLGEALMREFLSLLVASQEYEDNATPGFLVNPFTDEHLELDRYYPQGVAFEFNGPQHYGPTEQVSDYAAAKQQGRDYIKLGICVTRGIKLVVVHPEDLSLKAMRQKVDNLLPLRELSGRRPLVSFLERVSQSYRRVARAGRRAAGN